MATAVPKGTVSAAGQLMAGGGAGPAGAQKHGSGGMQGWTVGQLTVGQGGHGPKGLLQGLRLLKGTFGGPLASSQSISWGATRGGPPDVGPEKTAGGSWERPPAGFVSPAASSPGTATGLDGLL